MEKKEIDMLMKKVAKGDTVAFERLYINTAKGIFAFAYSYLKNYADAEDVTQEVFLAVKRKAFQYIPGTDARAWIFQIAKNLSRDELRRRKRRADPLDGVSEIEFAVEPRLPLLNQMTNVLDEREREIVILHAIWQYKHREIAEILSLPLGTVTWKYKAALAKLRVFLEDEK